MEEKKCKHPVHITDARTGEVYQNLITGKEEIFVSLSSLDGKISLDKYVAWVDDLDGRKIYAG